MCGEKLYLPKIGEKVGDLSSSTVELGHSLRRWFEHPSGS